METESIRGRQGTRKRCPRLIPRFAPPTPEGISAVTAESKGRRFAAGAVGHGNSFRSLNILLPPLSVCSGLQRLLQLWLPVFQELSPEVGRPEATDARDSAGRRCGRRRLRSGHSPPSGKQGTLSRHPPASDSLPEPRAHQPDDLTPSGALGHTADFGSCAEASPAGGGV